MTQLLQQALAKISKLPKVEQNMIARWVLEELASERQWEKAFSNSEDALSGLAREALKEHHQRKTKSLNFKSL